MKNASTNTIAMPAFHNLIFLESDFDTKLEGARVIESPFGRHNKFKRLLVDVLYVLKLAGAPRTATVVAPWGLFWAPGLLNRLGIKRFKIISLSCDTFLSKKTVENRTKGIVPWLKYKLAAFTYPTVEYFFSCSGIVTQQLLDFGVQSQKCVFQYREWIRNQERYQKFQTLRPSLEHNEFLFIGHCYSVLQKRVDLLAEAFLDVHKTYPDAKLTVVGRGWRKFFGKEKITTFENNGIVFIGETYHLEPHLRQAAFYVHPGEIEGFGLSVIESMLAGLIPLVSDQTGACEAARETDARLIFPLTIEAIAERLAWAASLKHNEREALSKKARAVAMQYKGEVSIPELRKALLKYLAQ